jgi:ABC-type branched-subunit amino acid transport system substrate-binding protein
MSRWISIALVLLLGLTPGAIAQQTEIPENEDAELLFQEGVAAFEDGDYTEAYRRFRAAVEYPLHQKTTAALLMGGRALYRAGRYEDAISILETLLDRYPDTTYRAQANQIISYARDGQQAGRSAPDTLRVGLMLNLEGEEAARSQAFFNGVRLAIDRHNGVSRRYILPPELSGQADNVSVHDTADLFGNERAQEDGPTTLITQRDTVIVDSLQAVTEQIGRPRRIAKMHVRQFHTEGAGTNRSLRAAVDSLVRIDQVDVIVGPFYSQQAQVAGAAAENVGVVFVAPLATESSVSAGRTYVFQANPTIEMRGRAMARYAAEGLLIRSTGLIYERGRRLSERMANGFRDEAQSIGMDIPFTHQVDNPRQWSSLPTSIRSDTTITYAMRTAPEAVYMPFSGRNAGGRIQEALVGLERLRMDLRVLGNAEWHDLGVDQEASKFTATYTNDFYVDATRPEVQDFVRTYEILTGTTPDANSPIERRLSYTGYDVADYLMNGLGTSSTRIRPEMLRMSSTYEGLGIRIDFSQSNINHGLFIHRYRNNRLERVQ